MKSFGCTLLAVTVLAFTAAANADAAVLSSPDRPSGLTATLNGNALTVSAGEGTKLLVLQGHTFKAACIRGYQSFVNELDPDQNPAEGDFSVMSRHVTWPAGATAVTVTFPRDESEGTDVCVLSDDSGAGGAFFFSDAAREFNKQLDISSMDESLIVDLKVWALTFTMTQSKHKSHPFLYYPRSKFLAYAKKKWQGQSFKPANSCAAMKQTSVIYVMSVSPHKIVFGEVSESGHKFLMTLRSNAEIVPTPKQCS